VRGLEEAQELGLVDGRIRERAGRPALDEERRDLVVADPGRHRLVGAVVIEERVRSGYAPAHHLADEDRVGAHVGLGDESALEMRRRVPDDRAAARAEVEGDALELVVALAREMLPEAALRIREDVHDEDAACRDQRVAAGRTVHDDQQARRFRRDTGHRGGGHAVEVAVMRGGDHRHAGRDPAHQRAEKVRIDAIDVQVVVHA
jgi:hypothetical protein